MSLLWLFFSLVFAIKNVITDKHHVGKNSVLYGEKQKSPPPAFTIWGHQDRTVFHELCHLARRGQQSSRFYVPSVVLFLLYFLLDCSSHYLCFLKAIMTTSVLPVGINSRKEKHKRACSSAELVSSPGSSRWLSLFVGGIESCPLLGYS